MSARCPHCNAVIGNLPSSCRACGRVLRSTRPLRPNKANPWLEAVIDGRWRIKKLIAAGETGTVFVAEHEARRFALKVIHPQRDELADRLLLRRDRLGGFEHPHLVTLHDALVLQEGVFVVTELVSALTANKLIEEAPFPWQRVVAILVQLCTAVDALHERGVVHGGLATSRLFIDQQPGAITDGDPYRSAASIDRVRLDVSSHGLRRDALGVNQVIHVVLPSYDYASPEQMLEREPTPASDVYSIAMVGCELLTKKLPFDDVDGYVPRMLAAQHRRAKAPSTMSAAVVPPELDTLLLRCLERDPASRFASARELRDALRAIVR